MKILNFIIYNPNIDYELEMFSILNKYLSFSSIKSFVTNFFIVYRKNISNNKIELEDNIIYVNGEESVLNIIIKTMDAFDYCLNILKIEFDYFYRTNISTITDFIKIKELLKLNPLEYGGFFGFKYKIKDNDFFNKNFSYLTSDQFEFIQGTNIIINKENICHLLYNEYNDIIKGPEYRINDDIIFGLFLIKKNITPKDLIFGKYIENCLSQNYDNYIVYRNKLDNRFNDFKNMNLIVEHLIKKFHN